MSKLRPSPAMVVACIALLAALGGPALAAPVTHAVRDLVTRNEIAPSAVRARHIGPRQVHGRHVRSRTLTLRTLTRATIAALRAQAPQGIAGVAAGGDLRGTYPDPQLRPASVGTVELANLAVTAPKLAPNAVGGAALQAGSVGNDELLDAAVTSPKLLDGAVALADLAVASVDSARVVDESLQAIDLGPGSVGSSEVANESLTGADLAANSVASGELADNTVTAEDLSGSSVGTAEIAPLSVTPIKQSAGPMARVSRTAGAGEQVIEPNQLEALQFNTARFEQFDFSIHDAAQPTRLTAPMRGVYLITAQVGWQTNATGRRELVLRHNGDRAIAADTETATTDVSSPFQTVSTVWVMQEDDYVEVLAQQTNSTNANLTVAISTGLAQTTPEFSLVWLGP